MNVPNDGLVRSLLALFVIEIDLDRVGRHFADGNALEPDIFERPAAHGVVLQAQGALQVRAAHLAVADKDIADATRDLAADRYAAVAVLHRAVADDQVFARDVDPPPVRIAAALDRDAIVARVERAALDQNVAAGFGIAAVVVGTVAVDLHIAHDDVLRKNRMNLPHRRISNRDVLDQNVLRPVGL